MGAHSPADVIVGLALGAAGLALSLVFGDAFDAWLLSSPHVWWVIPMVIVVLMLLYPRAKRPAWTSSPGDTAIIEGVVGGVLLGTHVLSYAHIKAIGLPVDFSNLTVSSTFASAGACLLGFAILVAVRGIVKATVAPLLLAVLGPRWGPVEDLQTAAEVGEEERRNAAALEAEFKSTSATSGSVTKIHETTPSLVDSDPSTASPRNPDGRSFFASPSQNNRNGSERNSTSPTSELGDSDPCNDASVSTSAPDGLRHRPASVTARSFVPAQSTSASISNSSSTSPDRVNPSGAISTSADHSPTIVGGPPTGGLVLIPPERRYEIELPLKLITYLAVGFNAVFTVPLLFQYFGAAHYGL